MQSKFIVPEPTRAEIDGIPGPIVLEFGTDWCPHCQELQPHLVKLLAEFPEIRHLRVEDGKGRPLGRSFQVRVWPNLVFMRAGKVIAQLARPTPAEVQQALASFNAAS